ncbi:MAG: hypothetical protein ABSF18_03755, partial [Gammaproteobacteria bacterium]
KNSQPSNADLALLKQQLNVNFNNTFGKLIEIFLRSNPAPTANDLDRLRLYLGKLIPCQRGQQLHSNNVLALTNEVLTEAEVPSSFPVAHAIGAFFSSAAQKILSGSDATPSFYSEGMIALFKQLAENIDIVNYATHDEIEKAQLQLGPKEKINTKIQ